MTLVPKPIGTSLASALFFFLVFVFPSEVFGATIVPSLLWQRSPEKQDQIVTETAIGTMVPTALAQSVDPAQTVFDNGDFTPVQNKNAVPAGVSWASWRQYSWDGNPNGCGPILELRHFQTKFDLAASQLTKTGKVILRSPNYLAGGNLFPVNDNAYVYLNNHYLKSLGTSYGAKNFGFYGTASFANETDGWAGDGDFGTDAFALLHSGQNVIDVVTGEYCQWGGLGKLELVIETDGPAPVEPFLDLPWDYKAQGQSFEQTGMNPVSWFDHEYPLQNVPCCTDLVRDFTGKLTIEPYRSHSGYDYGLQDNVRLDTPVLAAAAGTATFVPGNKSGGGGNVIKIDHGNGYQTWYEHLAPHGLIVSAEGQSVHVNAGQEIGRVGMTGNTTGPHIHFSVFKDANGNGSFADDYPFGLVDPLGWEGDQTDPWTTWTSGGRTGSASVNLFTARAPAKSAVIPVSGGNLDASNIHVSVPAQASPGPFSLHFNFGPFEKTVNNFVSVINSFFLDTAGGPTQFTIPLTLAADLSQADLSNVDPSSLSFFFFNNATGVWEQLASNFDAATKTISAQTVHLSHFAVMGRIKDLVPPVTTVKIAGAKGKGGWYRSPVTVELLGQDNPGGIGLEYTLYSLDSSDWRKYAQPLTFDKEGTYQIFYESYDRAENKEARQSLQFSIDLTSPEARIYFNTAKKDLVVEGIDQSTTVVTAKSDKKQKIYTISDPAGNTLTLSAKDLDEKHRDKMRDISLQYGDGAATNLPANRLIVSYSNKSGKLVVSEQKFVIKDTVKLLVRYDAKKNQSTIVTKFPEDPKNKIVKPGFVLLQVSTEKGTLKWQAI